MREIIFDTETTGFNHQGDDRMVEIGCIEMIDRVMTGKTFHCYFNPARNMPAPAEAVHGLSERFLSDKSAFAAEAGALLAFLGESPLVAHNAPFDFGFLNRELTRCGREAIPMDRMIDTIAIAKVRHPGAKMSLDALCTRYGIDRSHRIKHGALLDAELLAHLYIELTGGRQIGLGLGMSADEMGEIDRIAANDTPLSRPFRSARPHQASPDELERHGVLIDSIPDALWRDTGRIP
jgi:DNA polymerase III subunit epsilon